MSTLSPHRRRLGSLDVIEVGGSEGSPTVVLLHGYGADFTDLVGLAQALGLSKEVRFVFPNGPIRVPLGMPHSGRAWFPLSLRDLDSVGVGGSEGQSEGVDFRAAKPPGLRRACESLRELIEELGTPWAQTVLGGFSQGAIVALEVVLESEKNPAGLALLSGTLVGEADLQRRAQRHAGFEFFQSHGFRDPVLPFSMAQRLENHLREAGWKGRLHSFSGGHEIPLEVLTPLGAYVRHALNGLLAR